MDIEYIKENYRFETLNGKHDLSDFKCESDDLTDFLKDDSWKDDFISGRIKL